MNIDLSPDLRRAIMQYAAKEKIDFVVALECIVSEGIKSICDNSPGACPVVFKSVRRMGILL